jgi:tripartite-type tricarboxylate transporter receptor subunit TctC
MGNPIRRMTMKRAKWLVFSSAVAVCLASLTPLLFAQTYPNRPIQLVITLAPGDAGDITGRAIGEALSKGLNTQVVILNKTGGSGMAGADFVAKGKKDGYTVLYINSNFIYTYATNPENVPYNPFTDFEPLCMAATVPVQKAVRVDAPWKSFHELVDYVKENPGKVRGSCTGVGSVGHFSYEIIRAETGAAITMIPYKGASPAVAALLGGHVEVGSPSLMLLLPHFAAGKIRPLITSRRVPQLPNVPTMTELGYKRDIRSVWFGFFVPSGVPEFIKNTLTSAIEKAVKSPDVLSAFEKISVFEDYRPGGEFRRAMVDEYEMIKDLFKTAGWVPTPKN